MKKLLFFIVIDVLFGCSDSVLYSKEFNKVQDEYNSFCPIAKRQLDSMQIINRFIDNLPDAIKSLPEIRAAYIKNLDNSKAISDILINMDFKMLDLLNNNQ